MLEAKGTDDAAPSEDGSSAHPKVWADAGKPVLVILHQEHSIPGHVGRLLVSNGHRLDIRRPRFGCPLPETLEHHAGLVIFGGPMSANDADDFLKKETDFIGVALKEKKPFLGICLGAQMLARQLGAKVGFDPDLHAEIGYYPINVTEAGKRLCEWPAYFYQWHREGFSLPHGATLLVERDGRFPNQAISYGGTAFGLQFHPEITYWQVNRWTSNNTNRRLLLTGARPRPEHFVGHIHHSPRVHAWLDCFLSRWVRGAFVPA
jgi:GMP synthase (glutamine-hydrolysing)